MNKNFVTVVTGSAVLAVCGAGWLVVPWLQSAERSAEAEASLQIERARRLLFQYDVGLASKSLQMDRLQEQGAPFDPDELSEEAADVYQQVHTAMWEAYQPTDQRGDRMVAARANYGSITGQMRQGLRAHDVRAADNERLLDDALSAIGSVLSIRAGDASSQPHAEANRLQAVALYYKGLLAHARARHLRLEAGRYRRELAAVATSAVEAAVEQNLVAESGVDEHLARLTALVAAVEKALDDDRSALDELDGRIGESEARLHAVEARRAEAADGIARLKANGVDFFLADGAERFAIRLEALSQAYREADRDAHALLHGTYADAQIDRSGDFLTGRYVDALGAAPSVVHGLGHFRNAQVVLAGRVAEQQRALEDLRGDAVRLTDMKAAFVSTQSFVGKRIKELAATAEAAFAELSRLESEAFTLEDAALDLLTRSGRAAQQASRAADRWLSDARDRTQNLSSESKERSAFNLRLQDGWIGANIAGGQADAHLGKAWIHLDRHHAYSRNAAILDRVLTAVELAEADAEPERTKARDAHDAGVAEITDAMAVLERSHSKGGRHWTVTAQAAGASYVLTLFGHERYVDDTIEGYRKAIQGRENERFTQVFASRLARLEKR